MRRQTMRNTKKQAATPRPVTRQTRTRRRAAHTLEVSLLYGDGSTQDANPDGVGYYTHSTMAGFIRLEPRDLDEDPTNLTVTLSMPKQYVEKDSIRIPPFSTNSTITEYTIGSVEENGENYTISIYFTVYDRTQTLMLPFTLSFLDDVVPDNYRLPVTASVFAEDYEMQTGGQVRFHAYTVYRDPEHTHVPDGQTKVTYTNAARSFNSYPLDGETDDKIAYAFSDATIIAAQSMYAEKFIAPAGSDSWSKQGLLVKAGSGFDYLLEIVNETAAVHTGLTVYDTLLRIGDPNLFGASGRGSEFPVRLRSAITPPEGYTVYYTTSPEVYTHSMEEMVDSDIWTTSVTGFASVTAFKLVAGEGTELAGNSTFRVRIPVCAPKTFDKDSMDLLRAKVDQDQASGTVSWLQAVNAFGFRTVQTPTVKESNTVWARVCFAGFCVKADRGCLHARRDEGPGRVSRHARFRSRDDHAESRHAGIQRDLQRRSHRSWNIGRPAVHRKPRCLRPAQDRRPRDCSLLHPRRVPAPLRRRPPRPPRTPQPEALRQHPRPIHNAAGAKAPAAFFGKMPGLSVSSCKVLLHMLHFLLEKRTGGTAWIGIVSLRSSRASLRTTTLRRSGCAASWTRRAHISST